MDNIVIPIHSMVDVITNSSTELFVLDTNKSLDIVKEILQDAIKLHNSANSVNLSFEDIFDEPYIGQPRLALDGWEEYYKSNMGEAIIIRGASDNSIPFWIVEFLEDTFGPGMERFHLG